MSSNCDAELSRIHSSLLSTADSETRILCDASHAAAIRAAALRAGLMDASGVEAEGGMCSIALRRAPEARAVSLRRPAAKKWVVVEDTASGDLVDEVRSCG